MVHWVVFPVVVNCEPWEIALDFMSPSGYLRRYLLNKERLQLWYFPEDIWVHINKERLGLLWR